MHDKALSKVQVEYVLSQQRADGSIWTTQDSELSQEDRRISEQGASAINRVAMRTQMLETTTDSKDPTRFWEFLKQPKVE